MTERSELAEPTAQVSAPPGSWLWAHIGRISGIVLGLVALAFLVLLAVVGFRAADGILIFVLAMGVLIALGGRLHRL
jgi:hypothetical protein